MNTLIISSASAACAGQWDGADNPSHVALSLPPDLGPGAADARNGVCTVGAAPLVVNFNLPLAVRLSPMIESGFQSAFCAMCSVQVMR